MYWSRLSELTDQLISNPVLSDRIEVVGEARGIAWCLAVMANPYNPDHDEIRREVMRRYHAEQDGS